MTEQTNKQQVPQDFQTRCAVRDAARRLVVAANLLPPQRLENLQHFASKLLADLNLHGGLICQECGKCRIPELSAQADALDMPVLVAESSSRVAEWVEAGEIEAVVGVSCLNSLEKAFPAMLRHAVPGLAVPLLRDGCKDTEYDESFLADAMQLSEDGSFAMVSIPDVQTQMTELFTERIVSSYLRNAYPEFMRVAALAVECFHKASLIHDDIEDNDSERYGEPTMHQRIGIPVALNAGDFLVGEGYRLFCHESIPATMRAEMVAQAAQAHSELALGQAREFELIQSAVTLEMCLETHRLKTSPAFRVAMDIGAIAAGKFNDYRVFFQRFADLLGVSYQLHDDLEDAEANPASSVDCLMRTTSCSREDARRVIMDQYEQYRRKAFECLDELTDVPLKILLWRTRHHGSIRAISPQGIRMPRRTDGCPLEDSFVAFDGKGAERCSIDRHLKKPFSGQCCKAGNAWETKRKPLSEKELPPPKERRDCSAVAATRKICTIAFSVCCFP